MELALKESDEITHDELRAILKKNSLQVSAISTGQVFAARGLMFTDSDKERRAELWKSFTGFVDLASEFGGLVNVGIIELVQELQWCLIIQRIKGSQIVKKKNCFYQLTRLHQLLMKKIIKILYCTQCVI